MKIETPHGVRMLGRKPRSYDQRVPHYSALRMTNRNAGPAPDAVDWYTRLPGDVGMMLNDRLGDCGPADFYHAKQCWSSVTTGDPITQPDDCVEMLYREVSGYDGTEASDTGVNLQEMLKHLVAVGAPTNGKGRDKLLAFGEVDPRNIDDMKHVVAGGGWLMLGINIPDAWAQSAPGSVWGLTNDIAKAGHCVGSGKYDPQYLNVKSWGAEFRYDWRAVPRYTSEAYFLIDADWFDKTGKTPLGFDVDALTQAMQAFQTA